MEVDQLKTANDNLLRGVPCDPPVLKSLWVDALVRRLTGIADFDATNKKHSAAYLHRVADHAVFLAECRAECLYYFHVLFPPGKLTTQFAPLLYLAKSDLPEADRFKVIFFREINKYAVFTLVFKQRFGLLELCFDEVTDFLAIDLFLKKLQIAYDYSAMLVDINQEEEASRLSVKIV
jgi:hypothetical protein